MENIYNPGLSLVYNGILLPTLTQFTIQYPEIQPSTYYSFLL